MATHKHSPVRKDPPTSVRLPPQTMRRLEVLARETGRSKAFYLREAVEMHLEEMEDTYLAESTLERVRRGEEPVLNAQEFWRDLDD